MTLTVGTKERDTNTYSRRSLRMSTDALTCHSQSSEKRRRITLIMTDDNKEEEESRNKVTLCSPADLCSAGAR